MTDEEKNRLYQNMVALGDSSGRVSAEQLEQFVKEVRKIASMETKKD